MKRPILALVAAAAMIAGAGCSGDTGAASTDYVVTGDPSDGGGGDAGTFDSTPAGGPSCSNGVKDGDESAVDCGGATCPGCANGDACTTGPDCVSLVCASGICTNDLGCSDGTREGFASTTAFPNIAACAGGWSLPGLVSTTAPACAHGSGNGSANPTGTGCNVADLCQAGWHVCATAAEVGQKSGGVGCAGAAITGGAFFAVRQGGPGGALCGAGTNDIFGCGDIGNAPDATTCAPLDRFSFDLCSALPATWVCGADAADEGNNVTKTASDAGGVLCCRD